MTFAEDKTYEYIRYHYSHFVDRIHVLEILPYLSCLTTSDQDRLRASCQLSGNQGTLWELFNSLRRRIGWVESLINALRACELVDLAEEVACVYQSNLPGVRNQPPAAVEPQLVPAEVPRPPRLPVAPSAPHNGYREEETSFPVPVQDTQPPEALEESSKKVAQTPHSGAVLRKPAGPLKPSSDMAAASGHHEQAPELGGAHTAGTASSLPSPRGPVSPSVSFQPLTRSIPKASRLPAPSVSALSPATSSLSCAGGAGGHSEAGALSGGTGLSTSLPSTGMASSKLSSSSKPPGPMATNVITSLPPSKLPINSVRVGTAPPRVPEHRTSTSIMPSQAPASTVPEHRMSTSMVPSQAPASTVPEHRMSTSMVPSQAPASTVPEHRMSTSMVPSQAPASTVPKHMSFTSTVPSQAPASTVPKHMSFTSTVPSQAPVSTVPTFRSHVPSGEIAAALGSTISTRDSLPGRDPSSAGWDSESELSKPGRLVSQVDSEPFSGCSADLALSYSKSLDAGPDNAPEENEYQSVESIRIQVTQDPSVNLLEGNPGPRAAPEPLEKEEDGQASSWAPWLGAAAAGALLAVILTMLYRRRLLQ